MRTIKKMIMGLVPSHASNLALRQLHRRDYYETQETVSACFSTDRPTFKMRLQHLLNLLFIHHSWTIQMKFLNAKL